DPACSEGYFAGILDLAPEARRQILGQVRAPQEKQGKARVNTGLWVAAMPAAVALLPGQCALGTPAIPVRLANRFQPKDHCHTLQRPQKIVIGKVLDGSGAWSRWLPDDGSKR